MLGVAVDHHLMGLIALEDTVKPGVADMLAELESRGYKVYLLTGDHERTAQAIAQRVRISDFVIRHSLTTLRLLPFVV